ncbi:enoyl-CoA hydratase [Chloroflexota bacterium]
MEYSNIIYEKKNRIAKITLNRPEVLNAINTTLKEELIQALDDVEKDEEVDVLIITGAGRAFCAGRDLKDALQHIQIRQPTVKVEEKIRNLPIPTICAVNGYAITGGLELVMSFDIIIASENARFADTHARAGLFPGGGMSQMLPRLIGPNKAKELSFTGNYLSAQEALQFGLVNRVVPPAELQSVAEGIAQDILSCNQEAVRKMKYLINKGVRTTLEAGFVLEQLERFRWHESRRLEPKEIEQTREQVLQRGRAQGKKKTGS